MAPVLAWALLLALLGAAGVNAGTTVHTVSAGCLRWPSNPERRAARALTV